MRGGMKEEDEGIEMMEITKKTGTIVLAELPIPRDGFDPDRNVKESLRKPFFVTYNKTLRNFGTTNHRDIKSGKQYAEFEISKISETADGDNLLTDPIRVVVVIQLPTSPSKSYVLSASHPNPRYVELGPSKSKHMILEIK